MLRVRFRVAFDPKPESATACRNLVMQNANGQSMWSTETEGLRIESSESESLGFVALGSLVLRSVGLLRLGRSLRASSGPVEFALAAFQAFEHSRSNLGE